MPCNSLLIAFQIQLARIQQALTPKPHASGEKKPHADAQIEGKSNA